jgi:hypothetical protein
MKYTGTLLFGFGITFAIIELLGAHYGTPHPTGVVLAAVGLIGGLAGMVGGKFLGRDNQSSGR